MGLMESVQGSRILAPPASSQLLCNWPHSLFCILWVRSCELSYAAGSFPLCVRRLLLRNGHPPLLLCAVDKRWPGSFHKGWGLVPTTSFLSSGYAGRMSLPLPGYISGCNSV